MPSCCTDEGQKPSSFSRIIIKKYFVDFRSLATAAKMVSTENMLASGASMADRILSQAELLALLAERGCLNLMPVGSQNFDANVLRRLRDKLLQREQWNLALEVSTKAGLDNTGNVKSLSVGPLKVT